MTFYNDHIRDIDTCTYLDCYFMVLHVCLKYLYLHTREISLTKRYLSQKNTIKLLFTQPYAGFYL